MAAATLLLPVPASASPCVWTPHGQLTSQLSPGAATDAGSAVGGPETPSAARAAGPALDGAATSDSLPPSARAVLAQLASSGARTHKALVAESSLPPRTVRYALSRLLAAGAVEEVPSLRDARQSFYRAKAPREPIAPSRSTVPASEIRGLA